MEWNYSGWMSVGVPQWSTLQWHSAGICAGTIVLNLCDVYKWPGHKCRCINGLDGKITDNITIAGCVDCEEDCQSKHWDIDQLQKWAE